MEDDWDAVRVEVDDADFFELPAARKEKEKEKKEAKKDKKKRKKKSKQCKDRSFPLSPSPKSSKPNAEIQPTMVSEPPSRPTGARREVRVQPIPDCELAFNNWRPSQIL